MSGSKQNIVNIKTPTRAESEYFIGVRFDVCVGTACIQHHFDK